MCASAKAYDTADQVKEMFPDLTDYQYESIVAAVDKRIRQEIAAAVGYAKLYLLSDAVYDLREGHKNIDDLAKDVEKLTAEVDALNANDEAPF